MNKKKLILISYSSKDFSTADAIATLLRINGFEVWMAPDSIPGASDYLAEIYDAIDDSTAILLVLSPNSINSEWCRREVELGISGHKTLIPYEITQTDLTQKYFSGKTEKAFRVACTGTQMINGYTDGQNALVDLLKVISRVLEQSLDKYELIDIPKPQPLINSKIKLSHKLPENHAFFNNTRDKEIKELEELFKNSRIVSIYGVGGSGKSELAKGYARKNYKSKYKRIHFVTFNENLKETIKKLEFDDLNDDLFQSEETLYTQKLELLNKQSGKTLLIIDNCDVRLDDINELLSKTKIDILITTRRTDQNTTKYRLKELNNNIEEKLFILNQYTNDEDFDEIKANPFSYITEEDLESIRRITKLIGHHPLVLELIAKSIDESGFTYDELYENLKEIGFNTGIEEEVNIIYGSESSIGQIEKLLSRFFNVKNFSEAEKQLLRIMALVPVEGIPQRKLKELANLSTLTTFNNLVKGSWLIKNGTSFRTHPLLQKLYYEQLSPNYDNLEDLYRNVEKEALEQVDKKIPYLERQNLSNIVKSASYGINKVTDKNKDLIFNYAHILFENNKFKESERLLSLLEKYYKKIYDNDQSLDNLYNLNEVLIREARIQYQLQKKENIKRSLDYFSQVNIEPLDLNNEKHLIQAIDSHSYLGWALFQDQRSEKANELFEKEEELFNKKSIIKDRKTYDLKRANYLYNYSVTLYNVRDLEKATEKIKEALKIYKRYYSENHTEMTSALNELGFIELSKGNIPRAYDTFKKVLDIRLNNLGKDHPLTATAYNNIAEAALNFYILTGDKNYLFEASRSINETIRIRSKRLKGAQIYVKALLDKVQINIQLLKNIYNKKLLIETEKLLQEAYEITIANDYKRSLSDYYETEGDYYYFKDQVESALDSYDISLDIREKLLHPKHEKLLKLNKKVEYIRSLDI